LSFTDTSNFATKIQDLKNKPGKNISVEGGIGLWQHFLKNNPFDELLFFVHPTIFGKGTKLFDNTQSLTILKLKSSKTLDKGVIKLHYEK
jgi:dihydrofolate reductase